MRFGMFTASMFDISSREPYFFLLLIECDSLLSIRCLDIVNLSVFLLRVNCGLFVHVIQVRQALRQPNHGVVQRDGAITFPVALSHLRSRAWLFADLSEPGSYTYSFV